MRWQIAHESTLYYSALQHILEPHSVTPEVWYLVDRSIESLVHSSHSAVVARQRDRVASTANPYALFSLEIDQEINSLEVITEINPLEIVEVFGEIGGAWGK